MNTLQLTLPNKAGPQLSTAHPTCLRTSLAHVGFAFPELGSNVQSMPLPKTCPDPGAPSGSGSRQVTQTFPHTRLGKRGSRIFKRLGEEPARLQRGQQRSQLLHAHLLCPSYQNVCAPCSPKQSGAHASPVPNHFAGSNVANPTISQLSNCEGKKK